MLKYCWWLKSYTTWDIWNPINNGINYLSTGAGFQPSTVLISMILGSRFSFFNVCFFSEVFCSLASTSFNVLLIRLLGGVSSAQWQRHSLINWMPQAQSSVELLCNIFISVCVCVCWAYPLHHWLFFGMIIARHRLYFGSILLSEANLHQVKQLHLLSEAWCTERRREKISLCKRVEVIIRGFMNGQHLLCWCKHTQDKVGTLW